ncbi:putative F-box protein At1g31090 [Arabidopsis lyrata subsp. lyrata]|uniref:putative F-box protein At1g31090 n=1 Tax=Arabidopsis lyrata subsp. lyrata TaxID=81972 RepID=UPI000A29DB5D|nr:putative F-box protein At1g31090 [Arabidopsis lyrata subsp. lyrata]|eukprot:XP_020866666.1 putative F-box protein At1g31090 [Arabidopsis lyrata subsp. lyrata]
MHRGENSDSIPNDLIPEILSRLPAKSIARFRCVSKLWKSIIYRQDFTELFHTRSSSNPRLLIGVEQDGVWSFFSSPQPQNHYEKSSLVVAADFHMKSSEDRILHYCSYASGLIYFTDLQISKDGFDNVICNPSTGQFAILPPDLTTYRNFGGLLGYDPIGRQFKVLVHNPKIDDELVYHILTLGTENVKWREIKFPLFSDLSSEMICINGVLYYITLGSHKNIGCFDVRSEKFKFLYANPDYFYNWSRKLLNYKGKLGVTKMENDYEGGFPLKLRMWVLEDVEKEEWTTYSYTVRAENLIKDNDYICVVGATASGEIVLAKLNAYKPFYVFYFNPEKNTLLSVEIQGVGKEKEGFDHHSVYYFVDHVEDIKFDVMKKTYAATSIS